jgi:8-amino-7-oxononanoate synthase
VSYLHRIRAELAALDASDRRRRVRDTLPSGAIDFSSNDYLGLSRSPEVLAAVRAADRVGSGGSRLLAGAHIEHAELEKELAAFLGRERVLLFSSGFVAALGAVATLARAAQVAYSDERNHASLIDALRAVRTPRNILAHGTLPQRRGPETALFVTESIFSMDGDAVDTASLVGALQPGDIALVDEAHAIGVAGPEGAGLMRSYRDERVVVLGTLSKAFGAAGGFIAGPAEAIELAANVARSFVYDTAMPVPVAAAARAALRRIRSGDALRAKLAEHVARMRSALERSDGAFILSPGADPAAPFVSVVFGPEIAALGVARELEERGFFAPAIRPPTVPPGTSRLRVTLRADHRLEDIEAFASAVHEIATAFVARA